MSTNNEESRVKYLPSVEEIQAELGKAESIDDFFGKEGIVAKLFARTLEELLQAEMSEHLGYEKYAAKGRGSGNSRNGSRTKALSTSGGTQVIQVPRDRKGEFGSALLEEKRSNELEEKITALYAKGLSTRDIQELVGDSYGVEVSASLISNITDKVLPLVEEWQNRPLQAIYPIVYLDAIHMKLRRESKVENVAVYLVLGVDLNGHKDVLGNWVGDGGEGANFWLSVVSDLQQRGEEDIFIACVDGLQGFSEAIGAIFPHTTIQRCIIHQIRHSLRYVSWSDQKAFMKDLRTVYQAVARMPGTR